MGETLKGYRLINTKYPKIALFEDVASEQEFEALYALQALTNPRLQNEAGDVSLIQPSEIPYNCPHKSYAVAPFTHINKDGSRFADGSRGAFYIADTETTAQAEVFYHHDRYYRNVESLHYDKFTLQTLEVCFDAQNLYDLSEYSADHPVLHPTSYVQSQAFANQLIADGYDGIQYPSVRLSGATNWVLFSPKHITSIKPTTKIDMTWDGTKISQLALANPIKTPGTD
ncbi:RES family NAD+ phosphorylase [Enterovibrio norvegicus]|uniref:RES family NAD+ phosphorylase n=1 Tax=Enterovibrio norvegicus TaxID=188144 RepID=UPI00352F61E0